MPQMVERMVTAKEMAEAAGVPLPDFRIALRGSGLCPWHAPHERWTVPEGSPQHEDMRRVLADLAPAGRRPSLRTGRPPAWRHVAESHQGRGTWSGWRLFPDPRKGEELCAPIGPGAYDLRNRETGEAILFGASANVAWRLTSLLPRPFGLGTRRNLAKREYVLANISSIEYRTLPTPTRADAVQEESCLRAAKRYLFHT